MKVCMIACRVSQLTLPYEDVGSRDAYEMSTHKSRCESGASEAVGSNTPVGGKDGEVQADSSIMSQMEAQSSNFGEHGFLSRRFSRSTDVFGV